MSSSGQKRKGSGQANVVRFAPDSGHPGAIPSLPLSANSGRAAFGDVPKFATILESVQRAEGVLNAV